MDDKQPFAPGGDDGETEAVHEPHRGGERPTGSKAQPAAWLLPLGIVLLLFLGFLVGWGFGMVDVG